MDEYAGQHGCKCLHAGLGEPRELCGGSQLTDQNSGGCRNFLPRDFQAPEVPGEDPHSLSAILITHEHSDHIYGLATLAKKLRIPVFMTGATHQAWARAMRNEKGERPQDRKS